VNPGEPRLDQLDPDAAGGLHNGGPTPASGTSNCSTNSVKPSVGDDPDRVVMAVLAVLR